VGGNRAATDFRGGQFLEVNLGEGARAAAGDDVEANVGHREGELGEGEHAGEEVEAEDKNTDAKTKLEDELDENVHVGGRLGGQREDILEDAN
jgi:hypothetical protein